MNNTLYLDLVISENGQFEMITMITKENVGGYSIKGYTIKGNLHKIRNETLDLIATNDITNIYMNAVGLAKSTYNQLNEMVRSSYGLTIKTVLEHQSTNALTIEVDDLLNTSEVVSKLKTIENLDMSKIKANLYEISNLFTSSKGESK